MCMKDRERKEVNMYKIKMEVRYMFTNLRNSRDAHDCSRHTENILKVGLIFAL